VFCAIYFLFYFNIGGFAMENVRRQKSFQSSACQTSKLKFTEISATKLSIFGNGLECRLYRPKKAANTK